jgi:hypothetical protein
MLWDYHPPHISLRKDPDKYKYCGCRKNVNMNAVGGGNFAHLNMGTEDKPSLSLGFTIYMSLSCPEIESMARDETLPETHLQQDDEELCTCTNFLITNFLAQCS